MSPGGAVARRFMDALWAGDVDLAASQLAPDAVWVFQHGMPQAKDSAGRHWPARAAMQRIVDDLFGLFDPEGFSVTVNAVIDGGDTVAFEYEAHGRTATGTTYAGSYVTAITVSGEKVTSVRPYNDTLNMLSLLGLVTVENGRPEN